MLETFDGLIGPNCRYSGGTTGFVLSTGRIRQRREKNPLEYAKMIKHSYGIGHRTILALLGAGLAAVAFPPTAWGQELAAVDEKPPF